MTDQLTQVRDADGRYRTLLELTAAIDKETNVQVVLKSLHKLLSAVIHFDSAAHHALDERCKVAASRSF